MKAQVLLTSLAAIFLLFSHEKAAANSCALDFASLDAAFPRLTTTDKLGIEGAVDYLAEFEGHLKTVIDSLQTNLTDAGLSGSNRSQIQASLDAESLSIQRRLSTLADQTLESSGSFLPHEFETAVESIRRSALGLQRQTTIAIRRERGATFSEISENPELISSRITYQVPIPDSISGASAAGKLSVRFADEVVSELVKAPHESHRFMRSLMKGYIGPHAGDGILRITDQHEDLVEIKFVSKGAHRLIGCRRSGGLIEILKYYEKKNEGSGGSLKRFAKLCE
jgi:hypothetical protein